MRRLQMLSRILGTALLMLSAGVLLVGVSAHFWPETEGMVLEAESVLSHYQQQTESLPKTYRPLVGGPSLRGATVKQIGVRYAYTAGSRRNVSELVSIFSYFAHPEDFGIIPKAGAPIKVSYLDWPIGVSVLIPGAPIVAVSLLGLTGLLMVRAGDLWTYLLNVISRQR